MVKSRLLIFVAAFSILSVGALYAGRSHPLATNVTSNSTSTAVAAPSVDLKTFWGQVVCSSGACAQTQAIYGDIDTDAANGVLICTLSLSGTVQAQDVCASSSAGYVSYYVVTTGTSGTAARGDVYVIY